MGPLVLNSLEIQGFRVFRQLQIPHLGRVNLITGRNGVGKSCLLEALRLYASRGSITTMEDLLEGRDECPPATLPIRRSENIESQYLRHLFRGRGSIEDAQRLIRIGPLDSPDKTLSIESVSFELLKLGIKERRAIQTDEASSSAQQVPGIRITLGSEYIISSTLAEDIYDVHRVRISDIGSVFTPANGLSLREIGWLWDSVALTGLEMDVLNALRLIAPRVDRVTLIEDRVVKGRRVAIVKMADDEAPVPLRSLGEGMNRIFGLALALANARDGLLLIDEVESGLHYSVLPDLWRIVFATAQRLQVQVFATTHSWDCIDAFQTAARQAEPNEALLIRLRQQDDDIVPTLFDERKLAIVTREQIEVR